MTGIELERYLEELAREAAEAAQRLEAAERLNFVLGKMALLQTYLTSTGRSDASAFEAVQRFQGMVETRLEPCAIEGGPQEVAISH